MSPCFGIGSLQVGAIRKIDTIPPLDVIRDDKYHGNITGLPAHGDDDVKAERLAGELARISTSFWIKP